MKLSAKMRKLAKPKVKTFKAEIADVKAAIKYEANRGQLMAKINIETYTLIDSVIKYLISEGFNVSRSKKYGNGIWVDWSDEND